AVWRRSDLEVIAPVRELGLTREWEVAYATEHDIPVEAGNEGEWSIDANLWSRSIEGAELEDPGTVPPEAIYEWTAPVEHRPDEPELLELEFEDGYATAVDGTAMGPVELIDHLNEVGGRHGIGRNDLMEDRMLGLKVRSNYEHPAATILLAAHEALEGLVLTRDERSFKPLIDARWAEKAYEGLLEAPLVDALEGFLAATQSRVTGSVTMYLHQGHTRPVARDSPYAVYSRSAASFDTETVHGIEQADATGVAKYHGYQDRFASGLKGEPTPDIGV
ncbi:MAG: argininosuccinate synthase, partial [Halobacteriota archaeon]